MHIISEHTATRWIFCLDLTTAVSMVYCPFLVNSFGGRKCAAAMQLISAINVKKHLASTFIFICLYGSLFVASLDGLVAMRLADGQKDSRFDPWHGREIIPAGLVWTLIISGSCHIEWPSKWWSWFGSRVKA